MVDLSLGQGAQFGLNVPQSNTFNSEEYFIAKLVDDLSFSEEVNSLVIRAQGKGFYAGVDIKELQKDADKIYEVNDGCWKLGRAIHGNASYIGVPWFVLGGGILIMAHRILCLQRKMHTLAYLRLTEVL